MQSCRRFERISCSAACRWYWNAGNHRLVLQRVIIGWFCCAQCACASGVLRNPNFLFKVLLLLSILSDFEENDRALSCADAKTICLDHFRPSDYASARCGELQSPIAFSEIRLLARSACLLHVETRWLWQCVVPALPVLTGGRSTVHQSAGVVR
jgi:hypothetical protein